MKCWEGGSAQTHQHTSISLTSVWKFCINLHKWGHQLFEDTSPPLPSPPLPSLPVPTPKEVLGVQPVRPSGSKEVTHERGLLQCFLLQPLHGGEGGA